MTLDDLDEEFENLAEGKDVECSAIAGWKVFKAIARRPLDGILDFAPVDELMFEAGPELNPADGVRISISRSVKEFDDLGDYLETTILNLAYGYPGPCASVGSESLVVLGFGATFTEPPPGRSVNEFIDRVEASAAFQELVAGSTPRYGAWSVGPG
jgi:hypothetical protein